MKDSRFAVLICDVGPDKDTFSVSRNRHGTKFGGGHLSGDVGHPCGVLELADGKVWVKLGLESTCINRNIDEKRVGKCVCDVNCCDWVTAQKKEQEEHVFSIK